MTQTHNIMTKVKITGHKEVPIQILHTVAFHRLKEEACRVRHLNFGHQHLHKQAARARIASQGKAEDGEIKGRFEPKLCAATHADLMEEKCSTAIAKVLPPKRARSEVVAMMDDYFGGVGHPVSVAQPAVAEFTVLGGGEAGVKTVHGVELRSWHRHIVRGQELRVSGVAVEMGVDNINQRLAGRGINVVG